MNANELMIGDWVHVEAHRGFNAQNVKVETIPDNDGDNEYGHHYGHIGAWLEGGDNDFRDVEARHLQPIPLTGEMLEKNGWKKEDVFGSLIKYRFTGPIDIETGGVMFRLSNNYFFCSGIHYVHELQHALRMCGVEKDITI